MTENTTYSGGRCSMCGHTPLERKLIDQTFEYGAEGESITVTAHQVPVEACANCGEFYSGREAARVEHEAICQALGLMTPAEIKALRDRFGWSQKDLADLTGLGIATISRCERGRLLQNKSTNVILLGLRDCAPFREYLEGLLAGKSATSQAELEVPGVQVDENLLNEKLPPQRAKIERPQLFNPDDEQANDIAQRADLLGSLASGKTQEDLFNELEKQVTNIVRNALQSEKKKNERRSLGLSSEIG